MNRELNKIANLLRFTIIYFDKLYNQSPDYIIEKYDHFIGFEPTVPYRIYTPDNMETFFLKYQKRWGVNSPKIDMILKYLLSCQMGPTDLKFRLRKFEEYIGGLELIQSEPKMGFHPNLEDLIESIINNSSEEIKPILRDLKLKSIGIDN